MKKKNIKRVSLVLSFIIMFSPLITQASESKIESFKKHNSIEIIPIEIEDTTIYVEVETDIDNIGINDYIKEEYSTNGYIKEYPIGTRITKTFRFDREALGLIGTGASVYYQDLLNQL